MVTLSMLTSSKCTLAGRRKLSGNFDSCLGRGSAAITSMCISPMSILRTWMVRENNSLEAQSMFRLRKLMLALSVFTTQFSPLKPFHTEPDSLSAVISTPNHAGMRNRVKRKPDSVLVNHNKVNINTATSANKDHSTRLIHRHLDNGLPGGGVCGCCSKSSLVTLIWLIHHTQYSETL